MAKYISLYSGSSGNCSVVEEDGKFIIIDMGKSAKITNKALKDIGLELKNLQGILISHEHKDHISGLKVFLKNLNVPVYSNTYSLDFMLNNNLIPEHIEAYDMDTNGFQLGDFYVSGFYTPHDSVGCMGYRINTKKGSTMAIATDLGEITNEIYNNFLFTNLAVIESNYDESMLFNNIEYPYYLKTRIASNQGHLSNLQASELAIRLVKSGIEKIRFCHLSDKNNMPLLALSQFEYLAKEHGIELDGSIDISANSRHDISPAVEF